MVKKTQAPKQAKNKTKAAAKEKDVHAKLVKLSAKGKPYFLRYVVPHMRDAHILGVYYYSYTLIQLRILFIANTSPKFLLISPQVLLHTPSHHLSIIFS